ncbi:MAG: hypothetical protein IBX39_05855 [Candidatus Methanoperedenaceae archaeon]|nr:hypothetical protein [Candidatus Methanoperedenaceae archaeon]
MTHLWNKDIERNFFTESFKFATPEQLFYVTDDNRYLAYWPKKYPGKKNTLQSRNSLIGRFTEKWTKDLIQEIVQDKGLFAVQGAVCNEIALPRNSPADVVISRNRYIEQNPEDILAIFEVKMSVVWNWEFKINNSVEPFTCIGDYKTHKGTPGLLRSDSMLKAIGKSINIRVSNLKAATIPIIVLGNTPITKSYYSKVDHLKSAGIVQNFWSINPEPLDNNGENIKQTEKKGFYRLEDFNELRVSIESLLSETRNYFSSMKSNKELGKIIDLANGEKTYEKKGEVFLKLINE